MDVLPPVVAARDDGRIGRIMNAQAPFLQYLAGSLRVRILVWNRVVDLQPALLGTLVQTIFEVGLNLGQQLQRVVSELAAILQSKKLVGDRLDVLLDGGPRFAGRLGQVLVQLLGQAC